MYRKNQWILPALLGLLAVQALAGCAGGVLPMPMSAREARVVDPVLTKIAHGHSDAEFVGTHLFPEVPVTQRGGQVIVFGDEAFQLYATRRAPGAKVTRISFDYAGEPYALYEDAVEVQVPDEVADEASKGAGVDVQARSVDLGMSVMRRRHEVDVAAKACAQASYAANHRTALAGDAKWSVADTDPLTAVAAGQDAIAGSTGHEPNVMVMGRQVLSALRRNNVLREQFKYTSGRSLKLEMLQEYFDVKKVVVGRARYVNDGGQFQPIWGNVAVLAYVPEQPQGREQPSFGYTYVLKGHPYVNREYYDPTTRSMVHGVTYERVVVLTGMGGGYLIETPA